MGKFVQSVLWTGLFAVQPLFAQEDTKAKPAPAAPGRGAVGTFFSELEWWFWLLLVGLIVLVGAFFYLRNKQTD